MAASILNYRNIPKNQLVSFSNSIYFSYFFLYPFPSYYSPRILLPLSLFSVLYQILICFLYFHFHYCYSYFLSTMSSDSVYLSPYPWLCHEYHQYFCHSISSVIFKPTIIRLFLLSHLFLVSISPSTPFNPIHFLCYFSQISPLVPLRLFSLTTLP